ncbi:hypothetical protein PWP93_26895 [Paraburkholderia sp. A1RI-2L]
MNNLSKALVLISLFSVCEGAMAKDDPIGFSRTGSTMINAIQSD